MLNYTVHCKTVRTSSLEYCPGHVSRYHILDFYLMNMIKDVHEPSATYDERSKERMDAVD